MWPMPVIAPPPLCAGKKAGYRRALAMLSKAAYRLGKGASCVGTTANSCTA